MTVEGNNLWDYDIWSFIVVLAVLYAAMLLAHFLKRICRPLRRTLVPTPVLAGLLLLAVVTIYKSITGESMLNQQTLEALTYHGLGLGFVAVSMRSSGKAKNKDEKRDIFNSGLTTVGGYLIQGIIGLAITLGLSYLLTNVFPASGLLLPMGYGQGPGQAYNWGKTYQDTWGFENGVSFGLTVAAMGFIAASLGGVIYLAKMRREGKITTDTLGEGVVAKPVEQVSQQDEIPDSDSLDKLSIQLGLVFLAYLVTYGIMYGLFLIFQAIDPSPQGLLMGTANPLVWGFNFIIGTGVGVIFKMIFGKLYQKGICKRKYLNNYMLTRISNVMFDLMVTAAIVAIDLSAFTKIEFILPLALICIAGAVTTYLYVKFICAKLFPKYPDEEFLAMYGMLTGTASTGVVLLREIDPHLETPATTNLVMQALYAIIFGFPMLLLLGYAPRNDLGDRGWAWLTLGLMIVLLVVITLIQFRSKIFKRKGKPTAEEQPKTE